MIEKEEAKLRFKREQNELRKKRFHDARTRTMGVDVAALDAQVEEKRRSRDDKEEQNRRDSKFDNECINSALNMHIHLSYPIYFRTSNTRARTHFGRGSS